MKKRQNINLRDFGSDFRAELEKFTLEEKIGIFGSIITVLSLFFSWYSDLDVFRSGDTFTGLTGPLTAIGFSMFLLAATNTLMIMLKVLKVKPFGTKKLGKMQLWIGSASLYFLVMTHMIYFHPQFGLNILDKKSEFGVIVALIGIVFTCLGGFLAYRKDSNIIPIVDQEVKPVVSNDLELPQKLISQMIKPKTNFETEDPVSTNQNTTNQTVHNQTVSNQSSLDNFRKLMEKERKIGSRNFRPALNSNASFNQTKNSVERTNQTPSANINSNPKHFTEYERSKAYENLKRMMERDIMNPEQRKKLREKEKTENVFSAKLNTARPSTASYISPMKKNTSNVNNSANSGGDLLRSAMLKKR